MTTVPDDRSRSQTSRPARVAETHTAIVIFAGDRAFKVKKPVRLPFLDFSTPDRRRDASHREVELNRRIAPDVYLGVATLSEPDRPDEVAEHVVVMRRMPEDRALVELILHHDPSVIDHVREIARVVAAFHATATRNRDVSSAANVDAVRQRWQDNLDEMLVLADRSGAELDVDCVEQARRLAEEFLLGRADLLSHRADAGFVCDGHGDLQAADIYCLDDGPRVLDCIEFDDALRFVDVADDIAFLMMDLERLGATEAAHELADRYAEFSGHPLPAGLVHHYVAYRAAVRAKVAAVRGCQLREGGDGQGADEAFGLARGLLDQCIAHLEGAQVRLVVVGGLPGTGKTTLAEAISGRRGWTVLRSDVVRKEQAGLDPTTAAAAPFGAGLYDASTTDHVYGELLREADVMLRMGESVVLDASWTSARQRDRARSLASDAHARLVELRCEVDTGVANERLRARAATARDASDATADIAARMALDADPWPEAVPVTTDRPAGELAADLDDRL